MPNLEGPTLALGIDASGAQSGAAQYANAVNQIKGSATSAASSNQQFNQQLQALRERLDPTVRSLRETKEATDTLNRALANGSISAGQYRNLMERLHAQMGELSRSTASAGSSMGALTGIMAGFGATLGLTVLSQLAGNLVNVADAATVLNNQLQVATGSASGAAQQYQALFKIAQEGHAPLGVLVQTYQRMAIVQDQIGASTGQLNTVTKAIGSSLRIMGTSAEQAQGPLLQLAQALASPRVQAEEFNSVVEGLPVLMVEVAKHIENTGGTIAGLKREISAGNVTGQDLFQALLKSASDLEAKVGETQITVGQAMTNLGNSISQFVGLFAQATGATSNLSQAILGMSELLDALSLDIRAATGDTKAQVDQWTRWQEALKKNTEPADAFIAKLQQMGQLGQLAAAAIAKIGFGSGNLPQQPLDTLVAEVTQRSGRTTFGARGSDYGGVLEPLQSPTRRTFYAEPQARSSMDSLIGEITKQAGQNIGKEVAAAITSAFRSPDEQKKIYDQFVATHPGVDPSGYVAQPGKSDHQIGRAFDVDFTKMSEEAKRAFMSFYREFGFSQPLPKTDPGHFTFTGDWEKQSSQAQKKQETDARQAAEKAKREDEQAANKAKREQERADSYMTRLRGSALGGGDEKTGTLLEQEQKQIDLIKQRMQMRREELNDYKLSSSQMAEAQKILSDEETQQIEKVKRATEEAHAKALQSIDEYEDRYLQSSADLADTDEERLNKQLELIDRNTQRQLESFHKLADASALTPEEVARGEAAIQGTATNQKTQLIDPVKKQENELDQTMQQFVFTAQSAFEDAVVQALQGTSGTLKDTMTALLNGMMADITRVVLRQIITGPIFEALGSGLSTGGNTFWGGIMGLFGTVAGGLAGAAGGGSAASTFGASTVSYGSSPYSTPTVDYGALYSAYHTGGIVGRDGSPGIAAGVDWGSVPRYHMGLRPSEQPAVLQRGEGVFTPSQMTELGKPRVAVTVNNNTTARVSTSEDDDGGVNLSIDDVDKQMAGIMGRRGSKSNNAIRSTQRGTYLKSR